MDAVRPSGAGSEQGKGNSQGGKKSRSGMPVVPARGAEALSQGRTLLYGQMRNRAAQLSARRTRTGAHALFRIFHPSAREAEGQAYLRDAREAVRRILRNCR